MLYNTSKQSIIEGQKLLLSPGIPSGSDSQTTSMGTHVVKNLLIPLGLLKWPEL